MAAPINIPIRMIEVINAPQAGCGALLNSDTPQLSSSPGK